MTSRLRPALVASVSLAVLVVALGGCGGDGQESPEPAPSPRLSTPTDAAEGATDDADAGAVVIRRVVAGHRTPAAFLRRGNRICAEGSAELAAIADAVPAGDEEALLRVIADQVVPNIRGQMAELRKLGYPVGDVHLLTGILDDTDVILDAWEVAPAIAFTDTRMDAIHDRLNDYGLTSCGDS